LEGGSVKSYGEVRSERYYDRRGQTNAEEVVKRGKGGEKSGGWGGDEKKGRYSHTDCREGQFNGNQGPIMGPHQPSRKREMLRVGGAGGCFPKGGSTPLKAGGRQGRGSVG